MPTYTFRCPTCHRTDDAFMSIGEYSRNPPLLLCCSEPMERFITVGPGLAVVTESHYDGLRATDGSDISTRAKHRAYMREHGLTTIDDFTSTWQRDARERTERMAGNDPQRKADIVAAIQKLGG